MTPQDRAEAFIGRLVKNIRMPRLPNPVHKMPQGTGLGKLSNHPMGAIARGRQEAVNARATMDTRSTGQGAEPDDYARPLKGRDMTGLDYWQKVANEVATRDVGRRPTKAIRMPRLPNPIHKMPMGLGLPDTHIDSNRLGREQQQHVNARATMDTRSTGQGAEPVHGTPPPIGDIGDRNTPRIVVEGEARTGERGNRQTHVSPPRAKLNWSQNPKRRHPAF